MPNNDYAYAVARIHARELLLLGQQTIEQLMAARTSGECLHILADKGWAEARNPAEMLLAEHGKTWALIGELVEDMAVFNVFLVTNDYHNLKAAIKEVCTESTTPNKFISHGTIDPEKIMKIVTEHDFASLPEHMRAAGEEAFHTLLETRDGQLCDIIIDRAALVAVRTAGKASGNEMIKSYAEHTVATADIKIAVRANKTGKSQEFLRRALAPSGELDADKLARAAVESMDAICEYLGFTGYAGSVSAIRESPSAFERWCDNRLIERIKPQKYNPFTLAPLAAYILARENEIKTVRIILSGKLNGLPDSSIRERLREMYV